MKDTIRFGISLPGKLLNKFDSLIKRKKYTNRSEAIRDLIRNTLIEEEWGQKNELTMGVIVLVYDHHQRQLVDKIIEIQHHSLAEIKSTMHIHIDHHNCMEIIVIKGKGEEIRNISDKLISLKGVKYGKLNLATSGEKII